MDLETRAIVSDTLLRAVGVIKSYGDQTVVNVDTIEVRRGEVLALLGPNGAGKSTLVRVLAALETPDEGRLFYKGRRVGRDDPELRRAVSAVLQSPYLWRGTVAQNVEFGLRVRGLTAKERKERVRAALRMLEITDLRDAPVDTLSGGEAQRVALARALAVGPEILFLDEPTADLDVAVRRRLLADLERIVSRAAPALVLVTHDPGEAFSLADRVIVMEEGRIVQTGTPGDIFEAPATEFVASFTGAEFVVSGAVESAEEGIIVVRLESGQAVEAMGDLAEGTPVRIAYRPEDVVISMLSTPATSARNRFQVRVAALHRRGGLVRLRLTGGGLTLEALITRLALEDLKIQAGMAVIAQIKATALHVFPA
ncbi:MAG: ABC transporter ATP-binding protein [Gemmatimonadota bacterium]|nr:MAG: ABC transporter ATP-binding protein [Gemmatimonadota bacterium]